MNRIHHATYLVRQFGGDNGMTVGQIVRRRSVFFATNFFLSIDRETLEAADRTPRG
jgi:hypothetical protein